MAIESDEKLIDMESKSELCICLKNRFAMMECKKSNRDNIEWMNNKWIHSRRSFVFFENNSNHLGLNCKIRANYRRTSKVEYFQCRL